VDEQKKSEKDNELGEDDKLPSPISIAKTKYKT
jgi:hypothetical protein